MNITLYRAVKCLGVDYPQGPQTIPDAIATTLVNIGAAYITAGLPYEMPVKSIYDPVTGGISLSAAGVSVPGASPRAPTLSNFDVFDLFQITDRRQLDLKTPYSAVGTAVVHPSVVFIPEGWNGWRYWMAYTPYPNADSQYENPCVVVSNDGENWELPNNGVNPIILKPALGYNADPHLVMSPNYSKMYLVYRERLSTVGNNVRVMETVDGANWTAPATVVTGVYGTQDYASPSVWWDASVRKWSMISHNLDSVGYPMQFNQTSGEDIYSGWGANQAVTITNPTGGRSFWHSAFNRLPDGRVIGLVQDIILAGAGAPGALFTAESLDGGLTFAVRRVYSDIGFYRPNFTLAQLPSGETILNAWIGRQDTGGFHIDREDWRQGAVAQKFREDAKTISLYGGYPANWLWWDSFTKADGAIGSPLVGSALTVDTGTFTIVSNKLQSGSVGNNRALVSVGQADHVAEVVFSSAVGTAIWLWFRSVDANNFYRLGVGSGLGATLYINKFVGGVQQLLNQVTGPVYQSIVNAGDRVRVVCRGRRFRIYVNDVFWQEVADTSFYATGVKIGVQATNAGVIFDNLLATT